MSCPKNEEELEFDIEISETYHIAGKMKETIEQITNGQAETQTKVIEGYVVDNGHMKVLVEESDKNNFFPELRGLDIRERIFVDYIGGLTLA